MQLLNQFFCKRLLCLVDNQVDAAEVVDGLHDVIYIYRFVSSHADSVCLKDISRLFVRQTTAFYMVRVIGQVYLCLVIDAALHLHRLLLAEYVKQSLFMLVVVHITFVFQPTKLQKKDEILKILAKSFVHSIILIIFAV